MTSNLPSNNSNENRLYTKLISNLKKLQFIGYLIVVVLNLLAVFLTRGFFGLLSSYFFYCLFKAAISCAFIYITTEVLMAILDLLSRIERNTRSE